MVFITNFIQLTLIGIFLSGTTATVQVVGRNTSSSECDKYYLIPGDNTFNISSDQHQIDPACSLYYIGFGKADKKTGFRGMCYDDVDIHVACGYGNMFTIRSWSLVVHQNGSNTYLTVSKTVPPLEHTFTCHDTGTVLDNNHVCLENASMFEISVYIVTEVKRPSTIAFRTSAMTDGIDQEVTLENDIVIISVHCECDSDNCYNCHIQTHKISTDLVKIYINVEVSSPVEDSAFDVNNLIVVIGCFMGTLLVPVVVLLVKKCIQRDGYRDETEDTETIIEYSSGRLEPSSDAVTL